MRTTISLLATLLALASCSKDDSPKGSAFAAPTAVATPTGSPTPTDPDFDPARSILFRECRQANSVQACTCTVKMVKEKVDDDTYKTVKSMGMMGVMALKGPPLDKLRSVLSEAYDACARAEDDAVGAAPPPKAQSTFQPTPKASPTK